MSMDQLLECVVFLLIYTEYGKFIPSVPGQFIEMSQQAVDLHFAERTPKISYQYGETQGQ